MRAEVSMGKSPRQLPGTTSHSITLEKDGTQPAVGISSSRGAIPSNSQP